MNITLYNFSKSTNSLSIPSGGSTKYCHLKEATNITSPRVIMKQSDLFEGGNDSKELKPYNYAYIPSFKRYYYMGSPTVLDNDRVEIPLSVDVLASFRDSIISTPCTYVRTPNGTSNIIDDEYPLSKVMTTSYNSKQLFTESSDINIYIDIIGKADPSCNPTCTTYNMSIGSLKALLNKVYDPSTYTPSAGAVLDILQATICNPSQYIAGCRMGRLGVKGNAVSQIKFGWLDVDVEGAYTIPQGMYVLNLERTISFPSAVNDITHSYALYIPTVGTAQISRTDIGNGTLSVRYSVDMSNGTAFCTVRNSQNKLVFTGSGMALVPLPISGVVAKMPEMNISTLVAGATGVASTQGAGSALWNQLSLGAQYANVAPTASQQAQLMQQTAPNVGAVTNGLTNGLNAMIPREVVTTGAGSGTLSEIFVEKNIIAFTFIRERMSVSDVGKASYYRGTMTTRGYYRASYAQGNYGGAYESERNAITHYLLQGIVY